jgi:hypothetical protein
MERRGQIARPIEHAYRLAMVTSGIVTRPLRRMQAMFGKSDEVIVLARP